MNEWMNEWMKWDEMKWHEMKWHDMTWNQMKWKWHLSVHFCTFWCFWWFGYVMSWVTGIGSGGSDFASRLTLKYETVLYWIAPVPDQPSIIDFHSSSIEAEQAIFLMQKIGFIKANESFYSSGILTQTLPGELCSKKNSCANLRHEAVCKEFKPIIWLKDP